MKIKNKQTISLFQPLLNSPCLIPLVVLLLALSIGCSSPLPDGVTTNRYPPMNGRVLSVTTYDLTKPGAKQKYYKDSNRDTFGIPYAEKVGKKGYVYSPNTHKVVNVVGIASGTLVHDPTSRGNYFRVP